MLCEKKILIMQHVGTALRQNKEKRLNSGNGSQSRLSELFGNAHQRTASTKILPKFMRSITKLQYFTKLQSFFCKMF